MSTRSNIVMKDRQKELDIAKSREAAVESRLARQAAEGDAGAFTQIVERYQGPVYNLCFRYLGRADAEDAAQDTFVKAFVHRQRFDPEKPLLPWLMTIARRLCIDRLRRGKREVLSNEKGESFVDPSPGAEDSAASRQELELLADGLKNLSEGQREAIVLYHFDGLSYEEVAGILEVPMGTIMTWLHRGRAKLRKFLISSEERSEERTEEIKGG
ncbi:MAG: RNA polymerase sigma factor [Proteobacteria bacterium]|nr:RNA polymerase sigma factor [Pseudomonadota bacterium]